MRDRSIAPLPWLVAGLLLVAVGCSDDDGDGAPSAASTTRPPGAPLPMVVDTDLALDDLVALLFLLSSPEAEVRAITVSGTGEVRCPRGVDIARSILAVTDHDDVPVACGRTTPLEGDHAFPDEWRDASDDAYGLELPAPDEAPTADETTAVDLLAESLGDGGVTLLTLGPLTNVADAFRSEPDLAGAVASIVVMGGAVDTAGNVYGEGIPPSTAEWNLYVDPTAAAEVVDSGAPLVLVGLDATNDAPITLDFVDVQETNAHTEAATLVASLLALSPMVQAGEGYFWDPLAAAAAIEPAVVTTERGTVTVVTEDGRDSGRTLRSPDGAPVTIATGADTTRFEALVVRTLDGLDASDPILEPPGPVGEGTIRFDGVTCAYEGPASVPTGRMLFTFESSVPNAGAAVVQLTGELTIEQIIDYVVAHPEDEGSPPGVTDLTFVDSAAETRVDVAPPSMAVACASESGAPVPGGTFAVG